MENQVNRFTLQSDITIQARRAQAVEPQFADAIRQVLKMNNKVIACYLLDARKPDSENIIQIIALTIEDEINNIDVIAQQLWEMLQKFPDRALKTFVMSSVNFRDTYFGSEFYIRR